MQIIKPSTLALLWEFGERDADYDREFRREMAEWHREMRILYGSDAVRRHYIDQRRRRVAKIPAILCDSAPLRETQEAAI